MVIAHNAPNDFKVKCPRCHTEIALLRGFQEFDADLARAGLEVLEIVLSHYEGPLQFFRAVLDSRRQQPREG